MFKKNDKMRKLHAHVYSQPLEEHLIDPNGSPPVLNPTDWSAPVYKRSTYQVLKEEIWGREKKKSPLHGFLD